MARHKIRKSLLSRHRTHSNSTRNLNQNDNEIRDVNSKELKPNISSYRRPLDYEKDLFPRSSIAKQLFEFQQRVIEANPIYTEFSETTNSARTPTSNPHRA